MVKRFVCGANFDPEELNDVEPLITSNQSNHNHCPIQKTLRKIGSKAGGHSKNPYSARGLEKFSALLADLEEKKQSIYSQVDSQDILFVRFVYKSSNDCVPVVVKLKDKKELNDEHVMIRHKSESVVPAEKLTQPSMVVEETERRRRPRQGVEKNVFDWRRRPHVYLLVMLLLILVLLVVFGRSFAVLCTCLGWYLVPTLSDSSTKSTKKLNENNKKIVKNDVSSGVIDRRKSW